ncbi:MAG: ABC transporter permease [Myxococcota bacterium]
MISIATQTLLRKEVQRFGKVWLQTVLSPLVTTSLYFLVFGVALGTRLRSIDGLPYIEYVIPGLMMLAIISNSFLNSASSLFQSKVNGTSIDLMVAPLGPAEIVFAYVSASVLRGHLVGLMVWAVSLGFVGFRIHSFIWTIFFTLLVSVAFGAFGLVVAAHALKFDHVAVVPNFVLTPLTFLGGVFYSLDMLPEPWQSLSRINPVFYMVNGLRYGILGVSDTGVSTCAGAVSALTAACLFAAYLAVRNNERLRL